MFCLSALAALTLGLRLTAASPSLFRRWDFDICSQVGTNVPVPDHDNFMLPQQGNHQNMSWPFAIEPSGPIGDITFDFVQYTLTFTFPAIQGYTYTEADIWLDVNPPSGPVTPQYTTANSICKINTNPSTVTCVIPYQSIVGGITNLDWLKGMCPLGAREALTFYIQTNAQLTDPNGVSVAGTGQQSCTDYPTCSSLVPVPYWELTYRCSFCQPTPSSSSAPPPPPSSTPSSCSVGTAFGYIIGTNPSAVPINTLSPTTCKH